MSQQVTSLFTTNTGKKTIRQTRWFKATSDVAPISDAEAYNIRHAGVTGQGLWLRGNHG